MHKKNCLLLIPVLLSAAVVTLPLLWMVVTSLKGTSEIVSTVPTLFPLQVTLDQYREVLAGKVPFFLYLKNSLIVALSSSLIAVIFGNLAAYGFSRYAPRRGDAILAIFLAAQLFPAVMLTIPYYTIMAKAGLLDSYAALIITNTSLALPYATYMMKGYYDNLPRDLESAAQIDGCTRFQAYYRICLPLCAMGTVATFFMSFIIAWDEYVFALSMITSEQLTTLPVGITRSFMGQFSIKWGALMASGVLIALPPILIFLFLQKYFVKGQTAGAVKE